MSLAQPLVNREGGANRPPFLRRFRELPTALVFLLPAIVILGTFNFYPALYSLYLSFFEWNGTAPVKEAVGLQNYSRLLGSGEF